MLAPNISKHFLIWLLAERDLYLVILWRDFDNITAAKNLAGFRIVTGVGEYGYGPIGLAIRIMLADPWTCSITSHLLGLWINYHDKVQIAQ